MENYSFMKPPFEIKEFSEMDKREAKEHFDWFVSEIPNRIMILKDFVKRTGGNQEELNNTPESLVYIWKWFSPMVETIKLTDREMKEKIAMNPVWIKDFLKDYSLSVDTLKVAMDISIYFGQVFTENYTICKWGFKSKPKGYAYVNKPIIIGFGKKDMHPPTIIENLCHKIVKNEGDKESLLNMYNVWKEFIK